MVPLLAPAAPEPDWLTLGEAGECLRITEVSEAGSVPELRLHNEAERPVLLLGGEQLVGAKQNRVLNTTVLVPASVSLSPLGRGQGEGTITIPVSCVEQGRWGYRGRHMGRSDFSLYASLRGKMSRSVSISLGAKVA